MIAVQIVKERFDVSSAFAWMAGAGPTKKWPAHRPSPHRLERAALLRNDRLEFRHKPHVLRSVNDAIVTA
jgi:hypothetical protein